MTNLRRSIIFMPGDSMRKISKAAQMDVDGIIMDLEDGTALGQKEAARQTISEALNTLDFGCSERFVRLNELGSDFFEADFAGTIDAKPDGYVLPKTNEASQIVQLCARLSAAEKAQGRTEYSILIMPVIETALGVMNLREIAQASPRVTALLFGAEDLANDIGAMRTPSSHEVAYARSAVVIAAAAYGLHALDMVYFDLVDLEGFEEECVIGRQLGYDGKMAIHPKQVPIINRVFSPSAEEVAQAQKIVDAYQAQVDQGVGAFNLDGRMVDMPVVRKAEDILAQARLAGMI
ncbi:MAG: CoA ester lyase [Chloroflexota bacterium]